MAATEQRIHLDLKYMSADELCELRGCLIPVSVSEIAEHSRDGWTIHALARAIFNNVPPEFLELRGEAEKYLSFYELTGIPDELEACGPDEDFYHVKLDSPIYADAQ